MNGIFKRYGIFDSDYMIYNYIYVPAGEIILSKSDYYNKHPWDFYKKIKYKRRVNGRYMIKRQSLKNNSGCGWDLFAYNKHYYMDNETGTRFTSKRKKGSVFYFGSKADAIRMAQYLAGDSIDQLYSIVDRKNDGKETYIITKSMGNLLKKRKINIIVK